MQFFHHASSKGIPDNAPIAKALLTMDQGAHRKIKKKFEIAYFLSKENFNFSKIGAICELEELHKVDLGEGYKNRHACAEFVEYIAQDLRQTLADTLQKGNYFSIQGDGCIDASNVEE